MVAKKTSIRVPKVYRSFNIDGGSGLYDTVGYIVMDYIDGPSLDKCWVGLSHTTREDIVEQVADMISQLQSLDLPTPGPLGGGPSQGKCFSTYGAGPFADASDMEDFFNERLDLAKRFKRVPDSVPRFELARSRFVLTHQDIAPRNLVLDSSGKVWLIDWATSGAYYPILEIATLVDQWTYKDFFELLLQKITYDKDALEQIMSVYSISDIASLKHVSYPDIAYIIATNTNRFF